MASRRPRTPLRVSNARANAVGQSTSAVFGARANWETRTAPPSDGTAGTPYVPPTHGTGVGTWAALPAAGSFIPEVRPVADMTGSGRTGAGSGLWNGTRWEPLGGVLPAAGGPQLHARLVITQAVTNPEFSINGAGAFYSHEGNTTLSLGLDAAAFADEENIDVLFEGSSVKPSVTWISQDTFSITGTFDVGDPFDVVTPI